jgi:hypothetical protein
MTANDVILAIICYKLLVVDPAAKLLGGKRGAIDKLLRELEGKGVLQSQVITGRLKAYFLSADTCRTYGQPIGRSRPFNVQGLIANLGILLYCVKHGVTRKTRKEIEENAPHLLVPGATAERYVVPTPDEIKLLVVDHGSSLRGLAKKVRREWEKRRENYEWQLLQDHNQFEIVVIMAHQEKAKRLRAMLRDDFAKVSFEVFPELQKIVMEKRS